MSFRLKLFHRRREKVSPFNASNGALPSVSTAAETSSAEPNPQLQSLFLTLLPFDVRLMVYEHLLVVKPRLHVVDWQAHVKLSHLECDEPENDSIRHRKCWNHLNGLSKMFKRAVITLGVLQTCRIVYVHSPTDTLLFYFPDVAHIHYQTFRGSRCSLQAERIQPRNPFGTHILCFSYSSYFPQFDPRFEPASILVCMVSRVQRRKPETKQLSASIQVRVEKGLRCTDCAGRTAGTGSKH